MAGSNLSLKGVLVTRGLKKVNPLFFFCRVRSKYVGSTISLSHHIWKPISFAKCMIRIFNKQKQYPQTVVLGICQCPKTSTKLTFDHPIINASQKDAYSENFINIRPQIAELCTIWWPKPPFKLRFDQIWPPIQTPLRKAA